MNDKQIDRLLKLEVKRQESTLNLIASENYVSSDVRFAMGSVLTNKYSEGYPGKRYYGGNLVVDQVENLARERALSLFGLRASVWGVNVQIYSGSPANLAIYSALVPLGEKILGLRLDMGGHLSHGHKASFTGKAWQFVHYDVDRNTGLLNYNDIGKLTEKEKPKMIVAGYTAYSRIVSYQKLRRIADAVGAKLLIDMSHVAGLIAGRAHPSPFPYADVVMTTTHKTLRGPRGALIFSRSELSPAIDKAVFPGLQGGPHNHQTAAIAVALKEASTPAFQRYAKQVVKNASTLASAIIRMKWPVVTRGTDTHLFLVDVSHKGLDGASAEAMLQDVGIIINKNTLPYDTRPPMKPSGIRIGTPSVTTRGMKAREMDIIARLVHDTLSGKHIPEVKKTVRELTKKFPIP